MYVKFVITLVINLTITKVFVKGDSKYLTLTPFSTMGIRKIRQWTINTR